MTRDAVEDLFRAHAGAVLTFARRRVPPADAEDVVAEVFLVAWRRREEVPADALPWLFGVARRVIANRRRGEARRGALVSRLTEGGALPAGAYASEQVDAGALRALESLSDRDREILLLVAWEGLGRAAIASVLGVSRGAVAVRLLRAKRRFAAALDDSAALPRPFGDEASLEAR